MSVVKRLICLANSRKLSGRCVAGKVQASKSPGDWVRPVSDRASEEVSESERRYRDGTDPRVLDVIDVPLKNHHPRSYQVENWLLDPSTYWVRVGHICGECGDGSVGTGVWRRTGVWGQTGSSP
jgi:hypothetical protein